MTNHFVADYKIRLRQEGSPNGSSNSIDGLCSRHMI